MNDPAPILLRQPQIVRDEEAVTVSFRVDVPGGHEPVFFRFLDT